MNNKHEQQKIKHKKSKIKTMIFDTDKRLKEALKKVMVVSSAETNKIIRKRKDELEKIRLLSVINFFNYTFRVKEDAYIFRLLGSIFTLESLVAAKQRNKKAKVQKLFKENLEPEDKISLLNGFIFSEKYEFKKGPKHFPRHVMFEDFDKDANFKKYHCVPSEKIEFCSGSNAPICYCIEWLRQNLSKVDDYLNTLISNLYDMRHAIVHESFPVLGLPDYSEKHTVGSFSASLADAYPVSDDKKYFRSYKAYIDPDKFFEIIKNCIKNYLLS